MMRTFLFLFCTAVVSLTPKNTLAQNEIIKIDSDKEMSVDEVFNVIKAQTNYAFAYRQGLFKKAPKVKLKKGKIRLSELLEQTLSKTNLNVILSTNNKIIIKQKVNTQQRKVSGTITDHSGLPLPGVSVRIKGTKKGVSTNFDGQYSITVPDPANILVFSSLGFEPTEITVGNQTTIDVSLKESVNTLAEITITGRYYSNSRREETGSVSKMDAKTIEKQPVNNPLGAMQGHISGVDIDQNSGLPGTGYRIRIRGLNFIDPGGSYGTANDPLYIVDGVPYDTGTLEDGNMTGGIIPGGFVNPLNTLNPADIENIEVLKDADATAIYGSRGANGVIIITTKKGKVGKTRVKLNMSTTLSEAASFLDLLNTEQYLEMRKEAFTNDGVALDNLPSGAIDLLQWDQNRYTDWQEVLIGGTAYRQNTQLSFSGGSEFTQFLLSGGYVSETTVFPGDSKYEKASVLFNINHESKDGRFKLNASVNYGTDTNNLPGNDLTLQARLIPPNAPELYTDEGNINYWGNNFTGIIRNPLAFLETDYKAVTHNLIGNAVLSFRPTPSLEIKTNLGYKDSSLESYWAQPNTQFSPSSTQGQSSKTSRLNTNNSTRQSWIVEPQINWKHDWDSASLNVLVGTTFQQKKQRLLRLSGVNFPSNALILNITSANSSSIETDDVSEYKYQSFYGRINVNLQDKYIVNLTGRRDGSSRFGPGKQFGYFGAIGTAWLFSEEKFFKECNVLSFGKLRASYGITGSDNIGNYQFYDAYATAGNYNGSALYPTKLFNPNFAWGETKKLEAALELGFFKDRIFLIANVYRNRSSNQLVTIPLPNTTGFSGINGNWDAVVENNGLELDLRTANIKNEAFKWTTTFNISINRNKLVSFPGIEGSTFNSSRLVGESLTTRRLYNYIGLDPETGVYQFEDYNNDGELDTDDRPLRVDLAPKYFGGLGNTINYKNFQLDVFFQFKNQKIRKTETLFFISPGSEMANVPVRRLDRWQQPGDQNPYQGYFIRNNIAQKADELYASSNGAYTDGSFIRLRNVSLSYTVPKKMIKSPDLNIYLQGQNLFVIKAYDGLDPDVGALQSLPPLRQFTLGFNLSF